MNHPSQMKLQLTKSLQTFAQLHKPSSHAQPIPTHHPPPPPTTLKLTRRDLAICISSSPLFILSTTYIPEARAENTCTDETISSRAFIDVSIDGEKAGRIIIGLYGTDAPSGTARFSNLVSGAAGVSYRRKEFIKITPSYIQHGGVRSYGVDAELAKATGETLAVNPLIEELERLNERCPGVKNKAGEVSIIVRNPLKPPNKIKLVARKGKLEIDEEEVGTSPNGTEFVINSKDSPELDASSLVVGRVLEGMDVVEKMNQVKTVQENTSSNFFKVAKLIGDKRAVVAERGFNRPYSKVVIMNCGLMD